MPPTVRSLGEQIVQGGSIRNSDRVVIQGVVPRLVTLAVCRRWQHVHHEVTGEERGAERGPGRVRDIGGIVSGIVLWLRWRKTVIEDEVGIPLRGVSKERVIRWVYIGARACYELRRPILPISRITRVRRLSKRGWNENPIPAT